jgi:hypothetical protein
VAIGRGIPLMAILLLAAAPGWPQALDVAELDSTSGRAYAFESFTGPTAVVETVDDIVGVGKVLARNLAASGSRGDYFGKYQVIRAYDPAATSLLSADIIVLAANARVNHIRNVQRIVAGYLEGAFGYSAAQADRLAVLVTYYNAAYRGDIPALSRKYTPQVMANLSADNAGLALKYTEWPGRTRLVIPLARAAGTQAGTTTAPGSTQATGQAGAAVSGGAAAAGGKVSAGGAGGAAAGAAAPGPATAGGAAAAAGAAAGPGAGAAAGTAAGPGAGAAAGTAAGGQGAAQPGPSGVAAAIGEGAAPGEGQQAGAEAETGTATIEFPNNVIRGGRHLDVRFLVRSTSRQPLDLELQSIRTAGGTEILSRPVKVTIPAQGSAAIRASIDLPETTPVGRQSLPVELGLSGRLPVSPTQGILEIDYTAQRGPIGGALSGLSTGWLIVIGVLVLAALALLVLLGIRVLRTTLSPGWARAVYQSAREGYPLVEMVVTTQNRHIGHRNVHFLRPGSSAAVGGGRSPFLVYFVPVPPRIGVLRYDGRKYTFVPVRTELFPDLAGPVQDCLGKEIPARSPRGYKFTIVFRRYFSPLDEINRLMRSIRTRPAESSRSRGEGPGAAPPRARSG